MKSDDSTVLVADDAPLMQRLLASYLRDLGLVNIDFVDSGDGVVDAIRLKHYDLAFIDIEMPTLGGLEALPEVLAASPDTRVVMVSAQGTLANVKNAIEKGAHGFLVKPFTKEKLEQAVVRARTSVSPR